QGSFAGLAVLLGAPPPGCQGRPEPGAPRVGAPRSVPGGRPLRLHAERRPAARARRIDRRPAHARRAPPHLLLGLRAALLRRRAGGPGGAAPPPVGRAAPPPGR